MMDNDIHAQIATLQRGIEEERHKLDDARRKLNDARRKRDEERRKLNDARRKRDEERRKLDDALRERDEEHEERRQLEKKIEKLDFVRYLEECHRLSLGVEIITDKRLTTQGVVTDPANYVYPKRIIPWADFRLRQEEILNQLSANRRFSSARVFPAAIQLEYVQSNLPAISSEMDLRYVKCQIVEIAVRLLVDEVYNDEELRVSLDVGGSITFESQLRTDDNISIDLTTPPPSRSGPEPREKTSKSKKDPAEHSCVYRRSDDYDISTLAIQYKAPHKLSKDMVIAGLKGEIRPDEHIINQPRKDFDSISRYLTVAVITQLFACMVHQNVQYGYVCTGETFIFLYISDKNISDVYYHVCVPNQDATERSLNWLYRTGVAQVLAFVLQALRQEPPPQEWHQSASLDTWPDESEDGGPPASPSLACRLRSSKKAPASTGIAAKTAKQGGSSGKVEEQSQKRLAIKERPFCTHKCLSGMVNHGPMDKDCPNIIYHHEQHITPSMFLDLIRTQLAVDRGRDADAMPLYVSGSVGALFKICLSSHGYTLVAKGVESSRQTLLDHEERVYNQLQSIQGKYVPVCVGSLDLVLPYYYDGGVFEHFLFLSFAGKPLFDLPSQPDKESVVAAVDRAFKAIHNSSVLHRDAEPRNILYNSSHGDVMIIDFERSVILNPLECLTRNRKQKYKGCSEQTAALAFAKELRSVLFSVQRSLKSNATESVLR